MKKYKTEKTKEEFLVPENWGEVTLGQYYEIQENKESGVDIVSILTGFSIEELEVLGEIFINKMLIEFEWLREPLRSKDWVNVHEVDIMKKSLGDLYLLESLQGKPKFMYEAIKIYFVYLQPMGAPLNVVFPLVEELQKQLEKYFEIEKKMHKEPTPEQKRAGIEKFSRFGRMNTIDALAGGDVTKYDEVIKIDVNTVIIKLSQMQVEAQYEKNYAKIMHEKNK